MNLRALPSPLPTLCSQLLPELFRGRGEGAQGRWAWTAVSGCAFLGLQIACSSSPLKPSSGPGQVTGQGTRRSGSDGLDSSPRHCPASSCRSPRRPLGPHSQQRLDFVPTPSGSRDLASPLLGCGVDLRGDLRTMLGPYQQLIPSWPAPGLPFSEMPTLILTHGVFPSESPQPRLCAARVATVPP